MSRRETFCVVGAGLVGPMAALYLAERGHPVRLFERGAGPDAPYDAGRSTHLVVSARGYRALRGVGLDGAVRALATPLEGRIVHTPAGEQHFHPYGPRGETIDAVRRAELARLLATAAAAHPRVEARFGVHCVGVDLDAPALAFADKASGESLRATGDVVLGADGSFSSVRAAMMRKDRFDYAQQYMNSGYKSVTVPPAPGGRPALDPRAMHVWPRKRLLLSAFPNPDGSFVATLLLPYEGEPSFASTTSPAALRDLFAREFPDALPLIPNLADEFFSAAPSSLVSVRCAPWVYRGRVALVGDAAHAMVPFLGQGMNAGFEDCVVLAACLGEHEGDVAAALAAYEARRRPNCDAVTDMSLENFVELSERVADPNFARQQRLEHRIHERHPDRYVPLYPMVAFGHLPYADVRRVARAQEVVLQRLLARFDLEAAWGSAELDRAIADEVAALAPLEAPPPEGRP